MTQNAAERLYLPQQNDYHETVAMIDCELGKGADARGSLDQYRARKKAISPAAMGLFTVQFHRLGMRAELLDSRGERIDKGNPAARAFGYGAIAGAWIVDSVHQGYVPVDDIPGGLQPFRVSDINNSVRTQHEMLPQMLTRGVEGLELMGQQAENLVEGWEDAVVRDVKKRLLFRIGCGVAVLGAHNIVKQSLYAQRNSDHASALDVSELNTDNLDADLVELIARNSSTLE